MLNDFDFFKKKYNINMVKTKKLLFIIVEIIINKKNL